MNEDELKHIPNYLVQGTKYIQGADGRNYKVGCVLQLFVRDGELKHVREV